MERGPNVVPLFICPRETPDGMEVSANCWNLCTLNGRHTADRRITMDAYGTLPALNDIYETVFDIFNPKKYGRPIFPYAFKKATIKNPETQKDEEVLIVEIAVVGCSKEDVKVKASGNVITVTAATPQDPVSYVTYYDYIKRPNFSFSWTFPCIYDVANAAATVKDGLCSIAVKKKPDSGEKEIIVGE